MMQLKVAAKQHLPVISGAQEGVKEMHPVNGIEQLQQHVIETLQANLSHNKRISVIEDCRKQCTCCYVVPPYLF